MGLFEIARALVGVALLAVVPGAIWTRVLLPRLVSWPERVVASVVLSVLLVVLALYIGNIVAGIRISGATAIGWSLALSLAGLGLLVAPWLHRRLVVSTR